MMKFNKKKLAPIKISINGDEYPAKLTFGALSQIEEACGISFIDLFEMFSQNKQTAQIIIETLYNMLIAGGVEVKRNDIAEIDFSNEVYKKINEGIAAALKNHVKFVSDIESSAENITGENREKN